MAAGDVGDFYSFDDSLTLPADTGVSTMSAGATGIADPSSLQTINFGNGVTGYFDPNSNTYYDSGFNTLSPSDLSQYGAFTVGAGTSPTAPSLGSGGSPAPGPSVAGSGGALSGLGGLFSSVSTTIANAVKAPTLPSTSGTLVYNPATGGYTTAAALSNSSAMMPMLLLLVGAVVIYLVVRK